MFRKAFPDQDKVMTYDNLAEAIAAFERTLITHDRFDKFQNGDLTALNEQELRGLDTFINTGCISCHNGVAIGGKFYQKRVSLSHTWQMILKTLDALPLLEMMLKILLQSTFFTKCGQDWSILPRW